MEGDVREIRGRAEFRYATIGFAEDVSWEPALDSAKIVNRTAQSTRLRVDATADPGALLADAQRAGRVIEYTFSAPDLSEVFLAAIGRAP